MPVLVLGALSLIVALVVAVSHSWQVLVAMGAALEAMIYAVAAFCTLRLRSREPGPFRVRTGRFLAVVGLVVFGALALVASVSVGNRMDPVPLLIIVIAGGLSAFYVLKILPKVRAAEEARRAATPRRRPPRPRPLPGADQPTRRGEEGLTALRSGVTGHTYGHEGGLPNA